MQILLSNFKYIASLNKEYMVLKIDQQDKVYSEQQKYEFEKQYILISRANLSYRNAEV